MTLAAEGMFHTEFETQIIVGKNAHSEPALFDLLPRHLKESPFQNQKFLHEELTTSTFRLDIVSSTRVLVLLKTKQTRVRSTKVLFSQSTHCEFFFLTPIIL